MKLQHQRIALLSACIAAGLLSACGGGSGGGMVRSPVPTALPTSPPTPPPPPPVPPAGACPMPISGDCLITAGGTMLDGRNSAGALVVRLANSHELRLGGNSPPYWDAGRQGTYTFGSGTTIESGSLVVVYGNTRNILVSNVDIRAEGGLRVQGDVVGDIRNHGGLAVYSYGRIRGNVDNAGSTTLWGTVEGNFVNSGRLYVDGAIYEQAARISGNYTQASTGVLTFALAPSGWSPVAPLEVSGRADLDGTLELVEFFDGWGGGLPLPAARAHHILQAAGGVFGQFTKWTSPGLFVEGSLRYGSHDVWFDLTRISLASAMAGQGAGGITLASANNLDRLFVRTDDLALMAPGSLGNAQRSLLASAGSVLRIADMEQATRTLDSLSGANHADALQSSLQQGIADAESSLRMASMQPGLAAGAWSNASARGRTSGFDHWLSPRLLVGVQAGQASNATRDTFGQASGLSPQAGAYLRWFGDHGWYAGGSTGYAQHTLALERTLDLGRGGQWNAHARHRFNVAGVQGEAGRRLSFAGGTLTPYVALDATALRSERTIEQGRTGFELALQPAIQAQVGAALGLRFGRDWRIADAGWLRLEADARLQRRLADGGDPLRAAFVGVPDLWFDLPGHANRTSGRLDLGLRGGFGRDWTWSFAHARPLAGPGAGRAWSVGLSRRF